MDDKQYKDGVYRGCRGIPGSETYGESSAGNPEITLDIKIPEIDAVLTTVLPCTEKAWPYTAQRLRALGWNGDDVRDLSTIGDSDVDVELVTEEWEGKRRQKCHVVTGRGVFKSKNPVDKDLFAAKLAAITGNNALAPKSAPKPGF